MSSLTSVNDSPAAMTDRAGRGVMIACAAAGFATLVDSGLLGIVLPAVQSSLAADTATTQWILSSYSLTFGLALVPAGRFGDRWGRRRLLLGGLAVFGVSSLLSALAADSWQVVLARLVQGVAAGVISAQVLGVIQDRFDARGRAKALAAYGVGGALAGFLGPVAGGAAVTWLDPDLGWRLALVANVPFALLAIVVAARHVPAVRPIHPDGVPGPDLVGVAVLGAATVLFLLPVVWPAGPAVALVVAGGIAIVLFVAWERRYARSGRTPLLLPSLTDARGYLRGTAVAMFWFGAAVAHGTVLTLYLILALDLPPVLAALILLPRSVGSLVASALSWRLLARFGRHVITVGIAVQCLGVVAVAGSAWFAASVTFLVLVASIELVMGLAHGISEAPNRVLTLDGVPAGAGGVAAGFLQLAQRLSATVVVAAAVGLLLRDAQVVGPPALVVASIPLAVLLLLSTLSAALGRSRAGVTTSSPPLPVPTGKQETP